MTAHIPTAGLHAGTANRAGLLLAEHHFEIEEECDALRACALEGGRRVLVEQYRRLERAVLEHLDAEETVILPGYAAHDPDGAREILDEHATIRQLLFRVGIEVELHVVRLETLQRLSDALRAHTAREDISMYPWAQVHLPLTTKRCLFVRLGPSLWVPAR